MNEPKKKTDYSQAQITHCCPCGAQRTCHVVGSYYDELMDESYTDLSCGHHLRGEPREFDFCSKCGARVLLCYNS